LTLAELGSGHKVIYCFQHWCEGCHASGFPSLVKLVESLSPRGWGFAVVQTVFEGVEVNTPERLRETQLRYGLRIPFGHDGGADGYPTIMIDYRTGGTPWFIVIDPAGEIIHSHFQIDVDAAIALAGAESAPRWRTVVEWAERGNPAPPRRVEKSDGEWRSLLSEQQYRVARLKGTERPFSSEMCALFEPGRYRCVCCETPLFDAGTKFDSGTGWPSFTQPVTDGVVAYHSDRSHGMNRVEVTCNVCDAHLGHVFPDGPGPTGLRYCINAVSLTKSGA
jgi:methionine-R-sulfoxide reductase